MTLEAVRFLCRESGVAVHFVFYQGNDRLGCGLQAIKDEGGNLGLVPIEIRSRSLPAFRSLVSFKKVRRLKALMQRINPDVVVVSQGRIECSSIGLLAAKRAGLQTISYVPMAHPVSVSGKPYAVQMRDWVNRYLYRLPNKIITISERARRMLKDRGATGNVVVVPNGIETKPIEESDRDRFRGRYGIDRDEYVVAVVGRFDFQQKGQDFAVEAIARFGRQLSKFRFLFIGAGPDEDKLKAAIEYRKLSETVQVVPWTEDIAGMYAAMDMLLMPSKFEGVPLVMLEAMSYGLPIVASNVDGMADLLPQDWLFAWGDCRALMDTVQRVKKGNQTSILEEHRRRVASEFALAKFGSGMAAAILE